MPKMCRKNAGRQRGEGTVCQSDLVLGDKLREGRLAQASLCVGQPGCVGGRRKAWLLGELERSCGGGPGAGLERAPKDCTDLHQLRPSES